jgi:hypothetical protein
LPVTRARTRAWIAPRPASSAGAACCTGVPTERYVSAISSRRSSADASSAGGPLAAIQPSLSCGSAQAFDSPESAKHSAPVSPATVTARRGSGAYA